MLPKLLILFVIRNFKFMKILENNYLDFSDVLIRPTISNLNSRSEVDLFKNSFTETHGKCIPIIASNMDGVGTFSIARELIKHNMMTCLIKHYEEKQYVDFYNSLNDQEKKLIFYSIGVQKADFDKLKNVCSQVSVPNICLDVANAYTPLVKNVIKLVKDIQPDCTLMVGNVATPEIVSDFKKLGVNILKFGIGGGSVCTTRIKTGVGVPQLSCIIEAAKECIVYDMKLCSDGGITCAGDIAKAFGAGADMTMIGGMFAGCDECEGDWSYDDYGRKNKFKFYGMSSKEAMNKHCGGVSNYRASEGKVVELPYKGKLQNIVSDILGGLRSACTYTNSSNLMEIYDNVTFIKVNRTHNQIFGF